MRILHTVEFYDPSVGGAQEVVRQLSERLAKMGHDVTVAATADPARRGNLINGVKVEGFDLSGNYVRGLSGDRRRYLDFITGGDFDIMLNYAAQQWATDAVLAALEKIDIKKVIVPCGFSALYRPEYKEYFEAMKSWLKEYDACVYNSNDYRDVNFARKNSAADKSVMIPNGAGADEFEARPNFDIRERMGIPPDHFLILHVGSHTGSKGHKEAIDIFRLARIKRATFLMAANDFGQGCTGSCRQAKRRFRLSPRAWKADKRMIIETLTREETVAAFHAADLFLFPSNIECSPLVLFEAMASGTPFLTTDVGNSGEIIAWSNGGELLPGSRSDNGYAKADIAGSAALVERMFNDAPGRNKLAKAGYEAWKKSFTWEKIALDYEALYLRLLGRPGRNADKEAGRSVEIS